MLPNMWHLFSGLSGFLQLITYWKVGPYRAPFSETRVWICLVSWLKTSLAEPSSMPMVFIWIWRDIGGFCLVHEGGLTPAKDRCSCHACGIIEIVTTHSQSFAVLSSMFGVLGVSINPVLTL